MLFGFICRTSQCRCPFPCVGLNSIRPSADVQPVLSCLIAVGCRCIALLAASSKDLEAERRESRRLRDALLLCEEGENNVGTTHNIRGSADVESTVLARFDFASFLAPCRLFGLTGSQNKLRCAVLPTLSGIGRCASQSLPRHRKRSIQLL